MRAKGDAWRFDKSGVGLLEDHVDLAAGFQHFPGAAEAGRDDEAVAGAQGLAVALGVTQDRYALQDFAVFVLGVVHRPLPDCAFPHANTHLPTRAVAYPTF